jgi:glycosyltransferase involved in cell wall biosynthesis
VFCAAAVKRKHKRIDYLIREFSAFGGGPAGGDACLVISGARGEDSAELVALAQALGGSRIRVLTDVPRNQMPALYRASDVFALTSQFEMLGIVLLEAMASGLPCLGHDHPVLRWVIGPGGRNLDLSRDGALAEALREAVTAAWCRDRGHAAREQVLRRFSKEIVTRQCIRFYSQVLGVPMPVVPAS